MPCPTIGKGGLMYEASIGGQKFSYTPKKQPQYDAKLSIERQGLVVRSQLTLTILKLTKRMSASGYGFNQSLQEADDS